MFFLFNFCATFALIEKRIANKSLSIFEHGEVKRQHLPSIERQQQQKTGKMKKK